MFDFNPNENKVFAYLQSGIQTDFDGTLSVNQWNPVSRLNSIVTEPLIDHFRSKGYIEELGGSNIDIKYFPDKSHAITSFKTLRGYKRDKNSESIRIISSGCSANEKVTCLIPSRTNTGEDFHFFEPTQTPAVICITSKPGDTSYSIFGKKDSITTIKERLRRSACGIGLWQAAKGAGFLNLLPLQSSLIGMVSWFINQQLKQKDPLAEPQTIIGFRTFDCSAFPKFRGSAIFTTEKDIFPIETNPEPFKEIYFEGTFDTPIDRSLLADDIHELTIAECDLFETTLLSLNETKRWIGDAKEGSFLEICASGVTNGNSYDVSNYVQMRRVQTKTDDASRRLRKLQAGKLRKLFD